MTRPRRVLVTGAGRRIGAGLSIALAEAGWHVVLHYNQAATEAQTLCETLTAAGRTVELNSTLNTNKLYDKQVRL